MPRSSAKYQQIPTSLSGSRALPDPENPRQVVILPSASSRPIGKQPTRTTKMSHKLAIFPEESEEPLEEVDDDVYNQITQIPLGTARLDAERLKKLDRRNLPRVTAYCTAGGYQLDRLHKYFQTVRGTYHTHSRRFDECIHTPFSFTGRPPALQNASSTSGLPLIDVGNDQENGGVKNGMRSASNDSHFQGFNSGFASGEGENSKNHAGNEADPGRSYEIHGELFIFDYGVIVFWGMEEKEEMRIIRELRPFTTEEIEKDDVETEEFRFHYNSQYQPRIYNDIITLKNPHNYMTKLTISHAIAQSTKLALFERLAELRIEQTAVIPQEMASTGTVHMSRKAITKLIGQLFIVRINVNLVSNVLDTPEIFWSEPALEPLYQAIRGYLEISQRTEIINQRVSVIGDLLEMLKDHLNQKHSTKLEWIIIYVITFETIIGIITVCFDVYHLWD